MSNREYKTVQQSNCPVCQTSGVELYQAQEDVLFKAGGKWNIKKCSNNTCKTLWLDPKPALDELGRLYKNYYTHLSQASEQNLKGLYSQVVTEYCRRKFSGVNNKGVKPLVKLLSYLLILIPSRLTDAKQRAMGLNVVKNGRLLEVGCGNGISLSCLSQIGWHCEGIDFDQKAIDQGVSKGLKVNVGGIEDYPYIPGTYDAVVSQHVFEHLYDVAGYLKHCSDALKTGGDLVIYTPNADSLGHRLFKRHWRGLEIPRHLQVCSINSLREIVEGTGFKVISNTTTGRGGVVLYESLQIKNGTIGQSRSRILLEIFNLIEWVIMIFNYRLGEEIRIHAKKI